jgi:uncharacterized protein (TIGR00299 family) protein
MPAHGPRHPDTVLIDCHHAGIAGDMLLGALMDLGASSRRVGAEIRNCTRQLGKVQMRLSRVKRASISCTKADFRISDGQDEVDMEASLGRAADPWVRDTSLRVLGSLMAAESVVHGVDGEHHHLHELGRIDAVADIVGCAAAWRDLGLHRLSSVSTPVALGGGGTRFSHGDFPVPAPATLEILKNVPVIIGGERELTTPTGASLLVNLVDEFASLVDITPLKVGLGAGSDAGDFLNVTRVVLGVGESETMDHVDIIETSVDDATPEALAHAAERLMEEGALDVSILPSVMKKGRPGSLVKILAAPGTSSRLGELLLSETGSLGARVYRGVERFKLRRETRTVSVSVGGETHTAGVKLGYAQDGSLISAKPEYADVARICRKTDQEFPRVQRAILEALERARSP